MLGKGGFAIGYAGVRERESNTVLPPGGDRQHGRASYIYAGDIFRRMSTRRRR